MLNQQEHATVYTGDLIISRLSLHASKSLTGSLLFFWIIIG